MLLVLILPKRNQRVPNGLVSGRALGLGPQNLSGKALAAGGPAKTGG